MFSSSLRALKNLIRIIAGLGLDKENLINFPKGSFASIESERKWKGIKLSGIDVNREKLINENEFKGAAEQDYFSNKAP